jgi:hypothetical protein
MITIIHFFLFSFSRFYIPPRIFKLSVWQFTRSISLRDSNLTEIAGQTASARHGASPFIHRRIRRSLLASGRRTAVEEKHQTVQTRNETSTAAQCSSVRVSIATCSYVTGLAAGLHTFYATVAKTITGHNAVRISLHLL